MNSIKILFQSLTNRLYSFSKTKEYKEFYYQIIIEQIESEIFNFPAQEAIEEIDKHISWVRQILDAGKNFYEYFYKVEYLDTPMHDPVGGQFIATVDFVVPMSEYEKRKINYEISAEFNNYLSAFNCIKKFLNKGRTQTELIEKDDTSNSSHLSPYGDLKFTYVHSNKKTGSGNVKDLYNSLKKNEFIDESVKWIDFKKIFLGEEKPSAKVDWKGGKSKLKSGESTLFYFITQLFKLKLVKEVHLSRKKWIVTQALFTLNGMEINKPLKGQKPPKQEKELLDKIILTYSKE